MDLRKWFLLNERPTAADVDPLIKHVPCSEFRTYRVLQVFAAGYRTGFKLTDATGQPTEALWTLAELMNDVSLLKARELPDNVKRAFGIDDKVLMEEFCPTWYLEGLTDRVKAAFSALSSWTHQWVWHFLPGLENARVTYREDGKVRRRVCYIAKLRPNWELNDDVYHGLWRWNYDHHDGSIWRRPLPTPDAYRILEQYPALRAATGEGGGGRQVKECGAPEEALLQAAVGGV